MDWTVYPDTPISRLPRALRYPALLVRNLVQALRGLRRRTPAEPAPRFDYVYEADGLATVYYSPFQSDSAWSRAYEQMAAEWYPDSPGMDIRWRMWILTSMAKQAKALPGSIAEFGVYRAGCARMILGTIGLAPGAHYHLFDTFEGIPESGLTEREKAEGYAGRLGDTSVEYVRQRLSPWGDRLEFHPGDVFETLPSAETGELSLVHMDLNASAPTEAALRYAYPRLVPGGAIVFDDYGWGTDYEQRAVIERVCAPLRENLIALPSGQALLIKLA